jgi:predicted nucleotidyltransferase
MSRRVTLKSKDAAAIEEFVKQTRAVLGNNLIELKLFGSKATGKDQPDSDIDVLVAVEKDGVEVEDAPRYRLRHKLKARGLYLPPRH